MINGYVDQEHLRGLDRRPVEIESGDISVLARQVERERIPRSWFWAQLQLMRAMTNCDSNSEVLAGPVYRVGLGEGVARTMLIPSQPQDEVGHVPLGSVVSGTPVHMQIVSGRLHRDWERLEPSDRAKVWDEEVQKRWQVIVRHNARLAVNKGGWGSIPFYYTHLYSLLENVNGEKTEPYTMGIALGLLGTMQTLVKGAKEIVEDSGIVLGDFVGQTSSALRGIAAVLAPGDHYLDVWGRGAITYTGHSMGGYNLLKLLTATDVQDPELAEVMRGNTNLTFVADKPLIMGDNYRGLLPSWATSYIESPYYRKQVELQQGVKGAIVRAGATADIWEHTNLDWLRSTLGPRIPLVRELFKSFLTPKRVWDGRVIGEAHFANYFWDRLYHDLCIYLVDFAPPVMGDSTVTTVKRRLERLKLLTSNQDKILRDIIVAQLSDAVVLPPENMSWARGPRASGHHMSLEEIRWAYLSE